MVCDLLNNGETTKSKLVGGNDIVKVGKPSQGKTSDIFRSLRRKEKEYLNDICC
jgi:hypothetical protein